MAEGEAIVRGAAPASVVVRRFLLSSVGAKVIMALTGFGLWGFIIVHLLGNLQMFQGADVINEYGITLRAIGHGAFVWSARAGLLVIFILHVVTGMRLTALNRAARPIDYAKKRTLRTNPAALWMAASGVLLLVFLVFHLNHFAFGFVDNASYALHDEKGRHDIYKMVWIAFSNPIFVIVYIVGQGFLLAHLFHGTASLWQSIGFSHPVWAPALALAGRSIAFLIMVGNVAIPVAILVAWGKP